MGRLCRAREWAVALIGVAAYGCTALAHAGDPATFVPSYSGTQVMLYVSWSFGAQGARADTFGFRYERSSPAFSNSVAQFCAPLAHRSLVDLQFARGAAPRMQFGPRVTWDISRGRLAPTNRVSSWLLKAQPANVGPLSAWAP